MLLTIALVVLAVWGASALLPHELGDVVHILLLVGLMLLLLAVLNGRDKALRTGAGRGNAGRDADGRR